MEEVRLGFFVSDKCKGCLAHNRAGIPLRDLMDVRKEKGESTMKIREWLGTEGYFVSQPNLDRHFRLHSAHIANKRKFLAKAKLDNAMSRESTVHRNAEDEIQKLVDLGAKRVDDGDMVVDKEMYLFALDRKTRNQTPISVQNLVMNFGDALVESQREKAIRKMKTEKEEIMPIDVIETHESVRQE